jgi:hypothetical protein
MDCATAESINVPNVHIIACTNLFIEKISIQFVFSGDNVRLLQVLSKKMHLFVKDMFEEKVVVQKSSL